MIDPWSLEGAAQADHARVHRPRVRPFTLVLLAVLVALAYPFLHRPTPVYQMVSDGSPPVLAPTGALANAFDLARPATLRVEVRCAGVFSRQVMSLGSGFFFEAGGRLLTAYHVIDARGATPCADVRYVGVSSERTEYALELVGFDAYMDLAVMQATIDEPVPFIPLAARLPSPGADVVAIGNSRGDFLAGRAGKVTRLGVRAVRSDFAENTIELTASLAPGDSGGPVVTDKGEAVGVVSYISFNPSRMEASGYVPPFLLGVPLPREFASYAVPVEVRSLLVADLVAGGQRDVPVIGFSWERDYDPTRFEVDLGPRPGPIVFRVEPGGPADAAGLRSFVVSPLLDGEGNRIGSAVEADVIVAIDGVPTPSFVELLAQVRRKQIGDTVNVSVQRGSTTYRVELQLGAKRSVFAGQP